MSGKNKRKNRRLPELEDQTWFPVWLRDYQTVFLATLDRLTGLYSPVNALIDRLSPVPKKIVDLASGSGESVVRSTRNLRRKGAELLLTDKFPFSARKAEVRYLSEPLDVKISEYPYADLYTMFNAFHHFDQEEREMIALKARAKGAVFLVVEPLQPELSVFLKVFFSTLIGPLIIAPFMRPFKLRWIILTYILPIGLLATWWDGMVSVLRSLNDREWNELENNLLKNGHRVEHGLVPTTMAELKFFLVR